VIIVESLRPLRFWVAFHGSKCNSTTAPHMGRVSSYLKPYNLRAVHSDIRQLIKHSKHDCFLASSVLAVITDSIFRYFTELRTQNMVLLSARRSIRDFVTLHTGSGRYFPHQFKWQVLLALFLTLVVRFLLYISIQIVGNKAHTTNYRHFLIFSMALTNTTGKEGSHMQSNKTCPLVEDYINYLVVIKCRT